LEQFTISDNFQTMQGADEQTWKISYEFAGATQFSGLVRHVSPIRMGQFPMLTHDILVTSGDFADSSLVRTNVSNHHFTWFCDCGTQPRGTINLLHTVPPAKKSTNNCCKSPAETRSPSAGAEILRIDSSNPTDRQMVGGKIQAATHCWSHRRNSPREPTINHKKIP
jgi:hypothetical protein